MDVVEKMYFENFTNLTVHVTLKITDEGIVWQLSRDFFAGAVSVGPNQYASFPFTDKMCAKLRPLVNEEGKPPMTINNRLGRTIEFQFGKDESRRDGRTLRVYDRMN